MLLRVGLVVAVGLPAACDSADGSGDSSDGSGGDAPESDGGIDEETQEVPDAEGEDFDAGDTDADELRDVIDGDAPDGDADVSDLDADADADVDTDADADMDGEIGPDLDADMDVVDADLAETIDADGGDGLELAEITELDGDDPGDMIEEWPEGPWVRIGTGDMAWAPIRDGETLPVIIGFQGGYHVWGSLRASGVTTTGVEHEWALLDGSGVVAGTLWITDLMDAGDGIYESSGVAVQFGPGLDPGTFEGRDLTLRVELRPPGEPVLADSATIRVDCCY